MHPEQRRFLRALARSLPWALAAILVTAGLCALLDAPRLATSILVPTVALVIPPAYARREWGAMRAAADDRGAGAPFPGAWVLAAGHVLLPLVAVPMAVEGLRTGNRGLGIVGTSLLGLVVIDSAVVLPWLTARRQRRERAARAASRAP